MHNPLPLTNQLELLVTLRQHNYSFCFDHGYQNFQKSENVSLITSRHCSPSSRSSKQHQAVIVAILHRIHDSEEFGSALHSATDGVGLNDGRKPRAMGRLSSSVVLASMQQAPRKLMLPITKYDGR
eukprot:scaffold3553_cov180-Ochromonas_danica.AAC.18